MKRRMSKKRRAPAWESVQKWGRSVSLGRPGLVQGYAACSARWSVLAWRRCPDAFAVKRGGYLELRDAIGREFLIKNRDPDLRHAMCPFVCRARLWLLGHAVADDLVHRGLGYAAADRQALAMPSAVVDQRVRISPQVLEDSVQFPPQCVEFVSLPCQQLSVQFLDPFHRLVAFAMPTT